MWKEELYGQKLLVEKKKKEKDSKNIVRVSKKKWRTVSSQLVFNNLYSILCPEKLENKLNCHSNTKRCMVYTMTTKRSVDESRIRKAEELQRSSSEGTVR